MKAKFKIAALFLLTGLIYWSCVKDEFDNPPILDNFNTVEPNTTIEQLLKTDSFDQYFFSSSEFKEITENLIIKGYVSGNDISGNIYKTLFIQDGDYAIQLAIDRTGSDAKYPMGQLIEVKLKGLYIGNYAGTPQIGYPYDDNGTMKLGRIPDALIDEHILIENGKKKITPKVVDIEELELTSVPGFHSKYYLNTLISLDEVQFVDGDTLKTWAEKDQNTNRTLEQCNGKNIIVRTSGYSNFYANPLPKGKGKMTAILTAFNADKQLTLREESDAQLNGPRRGGSSTGELPEGTGTKADPYNVAAAFQNQGTSTIAWVEGYIVGIYETKDAQGNNLPSNVPKFSPPYYTEYNIFIADDSTTADLANCLVVQLPSGAIRDALNLVDHPENENKEVLLHGSLETYFSTNGLKSVDGYWLEGNGIDPPPSATGFFVEEFTNTLGQFSEFSVTGTNTWMAKSYQSTYYAEMSGYTSGQNTENEDWLISPNIDLSAKNNVTLNFVHTAKFVNNQWQMMSVWVSTDYTGTGDPNTATWTEITGYQNPSGNDYIYVPSGDLDLSAYDGESNFYLAFKYSCDNTDAPKWQIDYVTLKEL